MPKQVTTKRKGPQREPKDMSLSKKLQKASSQPALNSPPRPASATDSSLSKSSSLLSLTSGSSTKGSSSSAASSFTDKSSSAPSTTAACSASTLQETRPDHGGAQKRKDWDELFSMSSEEIVEYIRSQDREPRTWSAPHFNRQIAC
jgi:hypothetical protein